MGKCSGSAAPAIAGSAFALSAAVSRLDADSGARPTADTSKALKGDLIIVIVRGPIA